MADRKPSGIGAAPIYVTDGRNYVRVDNTTGALEVITDNHHKIHSGNHYFVSGFESEDTDGTIEFVVTTPNTTTWAHMTFSISSSNILEVRMYEGTSGVSGGSSATPINNNRNSSNTSGLTVLKDPSSISDDGTLVDSYKFGSSDKFSSFGGIALREHEVILKQDETYLWRFTSKADSNIISYRGSWYEFADLSKE